MYLSISIMAISTLFLLGSMLPTLDVYGHASPINYNPKPTERFNSDSGNPPNTSSIAVLTFLNK